jgi:hypothetical protein
MTWHMVDLEVELSSDLTKAMQAAHQPAQVHFTRRLA